MIPLLFLILAPAIISILISFRTSPARDKAAPPRIPHMSVDAWAVWKEGCGAAKISVVPDGAAGDCHGEGYVIALGKDTYPHEGTCEAIIRATRELDRIFEGRWDRIMIDTNLKWNHSAEITGLPFERSPGDRTGEIFTGPASLALGGSHLIKCHPSALRGNATAPVPSGQALYLWPPTAGYFPAALLRPDSKDTALPSFHEAQKGGDQESGRKIRMLMGGIDGSSMRGIFDYLRSNIEAWYTDPDVEQRIDVGHYAWPFLRKMIQIDRTKHRTSARGIHDWGVPELLPELLPGMPYQASRRVASPTPDTPASGVPFHRSAQYQQKEPIKQHQSPGKHSYAIAVIAHNSHRIAMQEYLWKKQKTDVNFIRMDFSDQDEIDDHFSPSCRGKETLASDLLLHAHMKLTKAVCESGAEVAVVLEDDALPYKDSKREIEHQIDALQKLDVDWGYHALNQQYNMSPEKRNNLFFKNSHHSVSLLDNDISLSLDPKASGAWAEMINCARWRRVEKEFFLNEMNEYRGSIEVSRVLQEKFPDKKFGFVADSAWKELMFLNGPADQNTTSLKPLVGLSLVEWATATTLHQYEGITEEREMTEMTREEAVASMRAANFPSPLLDEKDQDAIRKYFLWHMWIPRQNLIMHSLMTWFQTVHRAIKGFTDANTLHEMAMIAPEYNPQLSVHYCPETPGIEASEEWTAYLKKHEWERFLKKHHIPFVPKESLRWDELEYLEKHEKMPGWFSMIGLAQLNYMLYNRMRDLVDDGELSRTTPRPQRGSGAGISETVVVSRE